MTTSDYLKTQTALLIAIDRLRDQPLNEFVKMADAIRDERLELVDANGVQVATAQLDMSEIARCARRMVSCGPLAVQRKSVGSADSQRKESVA